MHLFPNLFLNFTSDSVTSDILLPRGPDHTTVVLEYLFDPDALASPGFDASDIIEFRDLVSRQDWDVCQRAQLGARSRGFAVGGVLPWQDRLLAGFRDRYLKVRGPAG